MYKYNQTFLTTLVENSSSISQVSKSHKRVCARAKNRDASTDWANPLLYLCRCPPISLFLCRAGNYEVTRHDFKKVQVHLHRCFWFDDYTHGSAFAVMFIFTNVFVGTSVAMAGCCLWLNKDFSRYTGLAEGFFGAWKHSLTGRSPAAAICFPRVHREMVRGFVPAGEKDKVIRASYSCTCKWRSSRGCFLKYRNRRRNITYSRQIRRGVVLQLHLFHVWFFAAVVSQTLPLVPKDAWLLCTRWSEFGTQNTSGS